ncbi:hypothetical protein GC249_03345 [Lactobacillus plantarum]|nr:hypothetical protein [Lactiplantibacillus plantarum]
MKYPVEFWLKHPDIDGIEVSSFGRARSAKGHYYKSNPINKSYQYVCFRMNGKSVYKLVHQLIAQAFIPNPNNLPQVNHKDGDRTNNNVSNLEWCDNSYNQKYREKFGVSQTEAIGHPLFAVNLVTMEVSRFQSQMEASRALGVWRRSLCHVIKGEFKQTHGFWFVNADDNSVDLTKQKLREIGETRLTAADADSANFVRQVLATYALERKLAYGKQKLA